MKINWFILLPGWTFTIALAAFSTPALTVAVSTCLEPRGGILRHFYYDIKCRSKRTLLLDGSPDQMAKAVASLQGNWAGDPSSG